MEIQEVQLQVLAEREEQGKLKEKHVLDLGTKDSEIVQVRLAYEQKIKDLKDDQLRKDHEKNCKDDHSIEEHRSEKQKLIDQQKDELCCLEHKIKKMEEEHALAIHKLTCENHAEHENKEQWNKVRDVNHSGYVGELAEKHEAELRHLQEQHEHDK